jgi:predicted nuclease of predicted toxin-antitoxin system
VVRRAAESTSHRRPYLLTFDLDFGQILALGILNGPRTVIFRLTDERAEGVNARLEVVLAEQANALASGALVLVEDARYRVRRLPIGKPVA